MQTAAHIDIALEKVADLKLAESRDPFRGSPCEIEFAFRRYARDKFRPWRITLANDGFEATGFLTFEDLVLIRDWAASAIVAADDALPAKLNIADQGEA